MISETQAQQNRSLNPQNLLKTSGVFNMTVISLTSAVDIIWWWGHIKEVASGSKGIKAQTTQQVRKVKALTSCIRSKGVNRPNGVAQFGQPFCKSRDVSEPTSVPSASRFVQQPQFEKHWTEAGVTQRRTEHFLCRRLRINSTWWRCSTRSQSSGRGHVDTAAWLS